MSATTRGSRATPGRWCAYAGVLLPAQAAAGPDRTLRLRLRTGNSYPALHLYIYTLLSRLPSTPSWPLALAFPAKLHGHLLPQLLFLVLYLGQLGLMAAIYRNARVPQLALVPLVLSKRAHSVYMLRLFGDCWAVALVSVAVLLWQKGRWNTGSVVYRCEPSSSPLTGCACSGQSADHIRVSPPPVPPSLALGVKMNILLYLPGLLLLYWKAVGPVKMLVNLALIALVQVRLPFARAHAASLVADRVLPSALSRSSPSPRRSSSRPSTTRRRT